MQYQYLAHFRKPPAGRSQRVGLVKRHGVRAVHGAEGRGWRQASGGSQRDWCTREAPDGRGPRTQSHSLTHNFRNHPPGAWGRVRGGAVRCGARRAWRGVRGESGRPIRVELHSVHAAMRHHSCRRLPRFHQLERPGQALGGVLGVCWLCGVWGVQGGSRILLRFPHRTMHVCKGLEKITQI